MQDNQSMTIRESGIKSFNTDRKDKIFSGYDDTVSKLEEDTRNQHAQLVLLKDELKLTRQKQDMYKKQYEDSIKLKDTKDNNLKEIIKNALENIIFESSLSTKAKEYAKVIMGILGVTEDEQKRILSKKKKK